MLLRLALCLAVSAPALADPGVTDREVLIGQPAAFTGASAALGIEMWRGAQAAFAEANANGGVHGRAVRLVVADDAYDAERAALAAWRLVDRDQVFALFGGVGTATVLKALPVALRYNDESALLYVGSYTGAQAQREPPADRAFVNVRASYREELRAMVDALVRTGHQRIGLFAQDDAFGASGRDGLRRALQAHGLSLAADVSYVRGSRYATSMAAQVEILRAAQVDAVVSVASYQPCAALVRDARRAGWKVPVHGLSFAGADQVVQLLRDDEKSAPGSLTSNLIFTQVVPFHEDDRLPFVRAYRAAMDRFAPATPPLGDRSYAGPRYGAVSLEGYLSARVLLALLDRAGPRLTRAALADAATHLGRFDLGVGAPLELTAANRQALHAVWFTVATPQGVAAAPDPDLALRGMER